MPVMRFEQLQAGMELDRDVVDRNGQPLVKAGTVLTDRDLRRFRMWGVTEVDIVGDDEESNEPGLSIDPAVLEKHQPEVRAFFKHTNLEHPFIAQLFQESLIRTVRQRMSTK